MFIKLTKIQTLTVNQMRDLQHNLKIVINVIELNINCSSLKFQFCIYMYVYNYLYTCVYKSEKLENGFFPYLTILLPSAILHSNYRSA